MITLGYIDVVLFNFIYLLFAPRTNCVECPPNALTTFPNRNMAGALITLEQATGTLLSLIAVGIIMASFRRASDMWRRAYAPVLIVGGLAFAALVAELVNEGLGAPVGNGFT